MNEIVNEREIVDVLLSTKDPKEAAVIAVQKKAEARKELSLEDVGVLIHLRGPELEKELFRVAAKIKDEIYGERLVFFAPLYVSDHCMNDCAYCNFHTRNIVLARKRLTLQEIEEQVKCLIGMGHKRVLLECGEDPRNSIDYVVSILEKIYATRTEKGNIRRVNVNIAATSVENYRRLKEAHIGTYQLFQETYHRPTYEKLHRGPKADYGRQITAHLRAFEAGLDDLGLGVLFGLYDWRFEVLALVSHARYLDKKLGVGPHTLSVPRFRPASTVDYRPTHPVSDANFLKLIAILRLAVPYTGMILSTRESPALRKKAFRIGISQTSAGSSTAVGGYSLQEDAGQFEVADSRPMHRVIEGILDDGLLPSFCTACYRLGRTGEAFMELAKPGDIHRFCRPNGLLTFAEYLEDFAQGDLYQKGRKTIGNYLAQIDNDTLRAETERRLEKISQGARDLYF